MSESLHTHHIYIVGARSTCSLKVKPSNFSLTPSLAAVRIKFSALTQWTKSTPMSRIVVDPVPTRVTTQVKRDWIRRRRVTPAGCHVSEVQHRTLHCLVHEVRLDVEFIQ